MNVPFTAMLHKSLLHTGPVGSLVCDLALTSVSGKVLPSVMIKPLGIIWHMARLICNKIYILI